MKKIVIKIFSKLLIKYLSKSVVEYKNDHYTYYFEEGKKTRARFVSLLQFGLFY